MQLTEHFSKDEMKCSHCGMIDMDTVFMEKLEKARVLADIFFAINSGFRCVDHPESIKNPTSSHLDGLAVDIGIENSLQRGVILNALLQVGFRRIGFGATFLHVDNDESKLVGIPEEGVIIWHYYGSH